MKKIYSTSTGLCNSDLDSAFEDVINTGENTGIDLEQNDWDVKAHEIEAKMNTWATDANAGSYFMIGEDWIRYEGEQEA